MSTRAGESTPQRAPSPLDIANALAWILEHPERVRADGYAPPRAIARAVRDHEALVFEAAKREGDAMRRAARMVWALLSTDNDARVLACILARAEDFRSAGDSRPVALEHALAEHTAAWAEVTRQAADAAGEVARRAWALAETGGLGTQAIVAAVDDALGRALGLLEAGQDHANAIAQALNETGASHDLASVTLAAWALVLGGEATDVHGPAAKGGA